MCKLFKRKHECVDIPQVLVREKVDQNMIKQLEQELLAAIAEWDAENGTGQDCADLIDRMTDEELRIFWMEIKGYFLEDGSLDAEMIEADANDMGTELALLLTDQIGVSKASKIVDYFNDVARRGKKKELRAAITCANILLGGSREYVEDMEVCRKEAGEIYLNEMMGSLNSIFSVARNRK